VGKDKEAKPGKPPFNVKKAWLTSAKAALFYEVCTGGFLSGSLPKSRIVENIGDFMDDAPELLNLLENEKKMNNKMFIAYVKRYNEFKKNNDKEAADYGKKLF